jgi:hypothetical protein
MVMATLRDSIGFVCSKLSHGPHVVRLVALLYLIDWSSAVVQGRRVTSLKWIFGAQGPEAPALPGFLASSREFVMAGLKGPSAVVSFDGRPVFPTLSPADTRIIEEIVKATDHLDWRQVQRLIHQSDPVKFSDFDQALDLEAFARNKRPGPNPPTARPAGAGESLQVNGRF